MFFACQESVFQLVLNEVANKYASSHFEKGVRGHLMRHLITVIIDYVQVRLFTVLIKINNIYVILALIGRRLLDGTNQEGL